MSNPIRTIKEKCVGCHKCVHECPVNANIEDPDFTSSEVALNTTIHINNTRCIQCGSCVEACPHTARDYEDDTEQLFNELKNPLHKTAIIIAPAIIYHFKDYKKIIG